MAAPVAPRWYNMVWRWHFYAGMLCVPFVLWLACTGTLYLWKPQIEALLDRPYDQRVVTGAPLAPEAQVHAALAAVPGGSLRKYQLPERASDATRVIVATAQGDVRVYLDPHTGAVLKTVREDARLMPTIARLHGRLGTPGWGSFLVEIAACWTIVMLLTGLYLWWPRSAKGLGGVLWPRLRVGRRRFWRDVHAVAGIWVAVFALLLIATGLPWAKAWGSYFQAARSATGLVEGPADWTIGGKAPVPLAAPSALDHAGHGAGTSPAVADAAIGRVVARGPSLRLAAPVFVSPPAAPGGTWTIASESPDRPQRKRVSIDGATGAIVGEQSFARRHWIDRAIGYGIAAHEGVLFGIANQLLGTLTALLLGTLSVSGTILWWRRRPCGLLGAPIPAGRPRFGPLLAGGVLLLAIAMPLFGASLCAVVLVERLILRRIEPTRRWLGLRPYRA